MIWDFVGYGGYPLPEYPAQGYPQSPPPPQVIYQPPPPPPTETQSKSKSKNGCLQGW